MYELSLETFFDTGLTTSEQKSIQTAEGYVILYDVTNKFSIERAKMYYKKILQIKDPTHSDVRSQWLNNQSSSNNPSTPTSMDSPTSSATTSSSVQTPRKSNSPRDPSSPTIPQGTSKIPFLLGATKCDVDLSERQVTVVDGLKLADSMNCPYLEVSGLKKQNTVEDLFKELIKTIDRTKKTLVRANTQDSRKTSFKVGNLLPKSVSENDNDANNYLEMRRRKQTIKNRESDMPQHPTTSTTTHL
ncbi:RAS-like protein [Acrasis kona]